MLPHLKSSVLLLLSLSPLAIRPVPAQSIWNGAGVTGGTGDTAWTTGTNWNPTGTPSGVDVSMTFNSNATVSVGAGAAAVNNVTMTNSGGTGLLSLGTNMTMASITAAGGSLLFPGARTATFTGNGDVYKSTTALASAFDGGDVVRFTGSNLTFATTWSGTNFSFGTMSTSGSTYSVQIDNPAASVDFNGKNLDFNASAGTLTFAGGQTVTNLPQINFNGRSAHLGNANGGTPLNMPNTALNWTNSPVNANTSFNLAGGTYKGLSYSQNSAQTATMVLQGDVTLSGTSFAGLSLATGNASAVGITNLNGKTLHVSNPSAAPVISSAGTGTTQLLLNNGTIRSANGLTVNANGAIVGSGTVRIDGGRLVFNSTKTAVTNLTLTTINLTNGATGLDWNSGSIDVDPTSSSASFSAGNFAIGNLSLGSGSYNLAGGISHDLLINGALTIGVGGVLSLGNWTGITSGGDAQTIAFNGLTQLSSIQSYLAGGQITATGLGSGLQLGIVQGNSNDMFYIAAVPEPNAGLMLFVGVMVLIGFQRMRRHRRLY